MDPSEAASAAALWRHARDLALAFHRLARTHRVGPVTVAEERQVDDPAPRRVTDSQCSCISSRTNYIDARTRIKAHRDQEEG